MKRPAKPPAKTRWAVRLIRKRGELLGIVYAPDEAAAIDAAAGVRPHGRTAQAHRPFEGLMTGQRRFPAPWRAEKMPGGYVVRDANDQAIAYVYSRANPAEALQAKVLTEDEARRVAVNIAKLPALSHRDE